MLQINLLGGGFMHDIKNRCSKCGKLLFTSKDTVKKDIEIHCPRCKKENKF